MKKYLILVFLMSGCHPAFACTDASPQPSSSGSPSASPKPTPTPIPVIPVSASANLITVLQGAKPGSHFQLAPKATYHVGGTMVITAANLSVDLNGSTLNLTPSPGASSDIVVRGAHFELFNGTIAKGNVFVRSYADSTFLHDLVSSDGLGQFFLGDVGSTHATIHHATIGKTNSVSVYWVQDNFTISNSSLAGSYGEYVLREEVPSIANPPLPKNALISNVQAHNHNPYGKQAIGIRMGSATIENSTIDGNIRIGQAGATSIGQNNPSFVIRNTQFTSLDSPQLSLMQGVSATVDGCTFLSDGITRNIAIDGVTQATLTNNVQKLSGPGVVAKALWATLILPGSSAYPKVTETGTKIAPSGV